MTQVQSSAAGAAIQSEVVPDVAIELIGVNKWYGQFHVLKDIHLKVKRASASSSADRPDPASRP